MRQEKREDRWREVVLAQKASGLEPVEYCRKEELCRTSFYAWRKRLGMAEGPVAGVKLAKGFMRLMPPASAMAGGIRIETPNGYRVEALDVGEGGLKSVLEVLKCL